MPNTTLIVPGLHGSDRDHWQSWWMADHGNAVLVEQSDWSNPHAGAWLAALELAVLANPHAIIVAHSLGAILTARLAQSRVAPLVAGLLLVAPADIERTGALHGRSYEFGTMPKGRLPFPSILVTSRDDPYMPFDKAVALGRSWGSPIHDLGHAGHVNVASGFGRWTAGYALASSLVADAPVSHNSGAVSISR
jgi:predicted alpha/beta hydrolase family esterase